MGDPQQPERDDAPPRYAAAPYISPYPQSEALRAQRAATGAPVAASPDAPHGAAGRPLGAADVSSHWDVIAAVVWDLVLIAGLVTLLAPTRQPALYGLGWFVLRFLPLAVTGTSVGGLLTGTSVLGPDFGWANPLRVLVREALIPIGVVVSFAWAVLSSNDLLDNLSTADQSRSLVDGRMVADALAGTWTVDRPR